MRNIFIIFFLVVFIIGCEQSLRETSKGYIGEKREEVDRENKSQVENVYLSSERESIEPKIGETFQLKEVEKEIEVKAEVLSGREEEKQTLKMAGKNEDIISRGQWFFAVHHLRSGYIDYYDGYGNFLGQRKK